jgi:GNAT superfamily N-acetyltransferase
MYEFTTDPERLHADVVHGFLTESYWAKGIDLQTVRRSMAGSLCFGYVAGGRPVAFARVITDQATFAYLADVFVCDGHRGRGLGKAMVRRILEDERVSDVRRWLLRTRDAHDLYARCGFSALGAPEEWMERPGG